MSLRTSAARYARALLDVAVKESDPDRVDADLKTIVRHVGAHADLRRLVSRPGIPNHLRASAIGTIAERLQLSDPVRRMLVLLAGRGRLELLETLAAVYSERLQTHKNIVPAEVTSAAPLAGDTVQAIERRLSDVTGKQMQLTTKVDPALIGGVVARIGSTVYDASIRTQLEKVKRELVEKA
jgi:F-type H+-transporting ATPase subunit delta